jgi:hypothetical protein
MQMQAVTYMRAVTDMEVYSFHLIQHLFCLAQYEIEMYYKGLRLNLSWLLLKTQ